MDGGHRMIADLIEKAKNINEVDFILKNATIVNVFNLDTFQGDVAIYKGSIVGIGEFESKCNVIDVSNKFIVPGLIDGHIHIESTMVRPSGNVSGMENTSPRAIFATTSIGVIGLSNR